jgi:DNA-binding transcriptional ArsR family regulator
MLLALSDGRARPAGELARGARVAVSTASEHLARLLDAKLLVVEAEGRHRYYRLSDPARVVGLIEALSVLVPRPAEPNGAESRVPGRLRRCRTCYDHLAGVLGVSLADACTERRWLILDGRHFDLSPEGEEKLVALGVDVASARQSRRSFARACLDWTERRFHLAGALGAALCSQLLDAGWLEREDGRVVRVTPSGRRLLRQHFGVEMY